MAGAPNRGGGCRGASSVGTAAAILPSRSKSLRDQILSKMGRVHDQRHAHRDLGRIRLVPSSDRLLRSLKDESFDERMGQDMTEAVFEMRTLSRGHGSIAPGDDYEVRTPDVQERIHYSAEFDRIETQVQGHH